jgi:hypothetical protein
MEEEQFLLLQTKNVQYANSSSNPYGMALKNKWLQSHIHPSTAL